MSPSFQGYPSIQDVSEYSRGFPSIRVSPSIQSELDNLWLSKYSGSVRIFRMCSSIEGCPSIPASLSI